MTTHASAPPLFSPDVVVQSLVPVLTSIDGVVTVMMQHIADTTEDSSVIKAEEETKKTE